VLKNKDMSYVKAHGKTFRSKEPHAALSENQWKTGKVDFVSLALDLQP